LGANGKGHQELNLNCDPKKACANTPNLPKSVILTKTFLLRPDQGIVLLSGIEVLCVPLHLFQAEAVMFASGKRSDGT
jgi:hypothetical protein